MNATPRIAAEAMAPSDLVERIIGLSEMLIDVVERETACLQMSQPLKIGELQEEKTRIANEYAMDIRTITLRKELIDRASAEKVTRLKSSMTKLDTVLTVNQKALAAAKSVSERILKSVADAVVERRAPTLGYGRNAAHVRSTGGQAAAIALDSRI
jgi:hypothetical protein